MWTDVTLETLIEEQRKRIPRLKLTPVNSDLLGTIFSYKYEGEDYDAYCRWLEIAKRYLNIYFPNDKFVNEFEIISKQMINKSRQEKMLYILESLAAIPQTITDKIDDNKGDMKMNINTVMCPTIFNILEIAEHSADVAFKTSDKVLAVFSLCAQFSIPDEHCIIFHHIVV